MGGAQKHMMHPYDNLDLTFWDLYQISNLFIENKTNTFNEKIDGINITWRRGKGNSVYVTRNMGHCKIGGINIKDWMQELIDTNHPGKDQFLAGCKMILELIECQPPQEDELNYWFNTEVVCKNHPQTIKYCTDALIIHSIGYYDFEKNKIVKFDDDLFNKVYMKLRGHATNISFYMIKKLEVQITSQFNENYFEWFSVLQNEMLQTDSTWRTTLREYAAVKLFDRFRELPKPFPSMIIDNILGRKPKRHNLNKIKSQWKQWCKDNNINNVKSGLDKISEFGLAKHSDKWINYAMQEIRHGWQTWGCVVLSSVKSTILAEDAIERYCNVLGNQQKEIMMRRDFEALDEVYRFEQDWRLVSNGYFPTVEGVVFEYHDQLYKMTGAFRSFNRLIGVARYKYNVSME